MPRIIENRYHIPFKQIIERFENGELITNLKVIVCPTCLGGWKTLDMVCPLCRGRHTVIRKEEISIISFEDVEEDEVYSEKEFELFNNDEI